MQFISNMAGALILCTLIARESVNQMESEVESLQPSEDLLCNLCII